MNRHEQRIVNKPATLSGTPEKEALDELLREARELSWQRFGKKITFYVPGMFVCNGTRGKYPAISITGSQCELQCEHCRGVLLKPMIEALSPEALIEKCLRLNEKNAIGCLISGGSSKNGQLPWDRFAPAIAEIKKKTKLKVSVHTGFLDRPTAETLKEVGVDQALIDVVGADETMKEIFHLDYGIEQVERSLAAVYEVGLNVVPHIIIGLHYGELKGEARALEMLKKYKPEMLVFITMMPLPGTELFKLDRPYPEEVAEIIARARLAMPDTTISLGCARPRDKRGEFIELYAIDGGVSRMALYSDEAVQRAEAYGLEITYEKSCCSSGCSGH
ncbi:MAG: radical SAM protein [bacterium]|nr:radical SAM protein [bacterium]